MAEPIRSKIVGLSWRKLKSDHVLQSRENVDDSPPAMNLRPRGFNGTPQSGSSQRSDGQTEKFLRRARSFRLMKDAFGTLRQKLRVQSKGHKRLINNSPYGVPLTPRTPRTTPRRAPGCGVKMYSPFTIDTPSSKRNTPRNIRMGVHSARRCNFGSPGDYQKKLKSVEDGVRELCDLGKRFDQCIQNRVEDVPPSGRLGSRRSPRTSSSSIKKLSPTFV